jgi:hypothetical protein
VGHATAVPKLAKDAAFRVVDGFCHPTPTLDLIFCPKARTVDDALALLGDSGAFGYDQAGCTSLAVILAHQRRRNVIRGRAGPHHRRHPNAIGKRKAVKIHGREQIKKVSNVIQEPTFGAAWGVIEKRSPLFAPQLLRPTELPEQISIARRWLTHLREGGSGARQHIQPKFSISISPLDDARWSDPFDEEISSFVAAEGIVR